MADTGSRRRQVGAPDNAMWPIPTVARLGWAAIWLVFLGYPISRHPRHRILPGQSRHRMDLPGRLRRHVSVRDVDLPLAGAARRDRRAAPSARRRSSWWASRSRWSSGDSGPACSCTAASPPGGRCAGAILVPVLFALGVFMVVSGALLGYAWADLGFITFLTVALGFTMLAFRRLIATCHRAAHGARRGRASGDRRTSGCASLAMFMTSLATACR